MNLIEGNDCFPIVRITRHLPDLFSQRVFVHQLNCHRLWAEMVLRTELGDLHWPKAKSAVKTIIDNYVTFDLLRIQLL